jgi:crotonobetainyl-CoA:carnitine CoA-transferase CaiB-like acyl-CoA transferase
MFAATAITAALYERHSTGRGRDLDIAMQDSLVSMLTHQAARYLATGELPPKDDNGHSAIAPYGMFEASDGHINLCVGNDAQFRRMCAALDLTQLELDERFDTNSARLAHKEDLLAVIGARLLELTRSEAIARLEQAGVPVGAVHDLADVLHDPRLRRRSMVVPIEREGHGRAEVVNGPWKVDGGSCAVYRQPPRLGEHTDEVLAELSRPPQRRRAPAAPPSTPDGGR